MKRYIQISLLSFALIFICGCKDNPASKAEKLYKDKGLDAYVEFVESKNTYYQFADSNNNGATPLLVAIMEGKINVIPTLLKYGASVYLERDKTGKDTFDYLLEKTSDEIKEVVDAIPSDYWYLERNIERLLENEKNYSIFSLLVDKNKFSPDYVLEKGKTILMYAAQHTTDIRYFTLLAKKTDDINRVNDNEWNAIMYAARYNPNPSVLEYFLEKDGNTDRNTAGISLTMLAACNPNPGVLLKVPTTEKYLNTVTENGKTALMYACENNQSIDFIEILCRSFNEDINAVDSEGKTALMYALKTNIETTVCEYLLKSGARVDISDNSGKTIRNYLDSNIKLKDLSTTIYFHEKEKENEN